VPGGGVRRIRFEASLCKKLARPSHLNKKRKLGLVGFFAGMGKIFKSKTLAEK
jgi:hypothetical protein